MGTKMNATAMRLGVNKTWKSSWYANGKTFVKYLLEDNKIRNFLDNKIGSAGLDSVEIRRPAGKTIVIVHVSSPGVVIGRQGSGIESIKATLNKMLKTEVDLRIKEVKSPDLSAMVVARSISSGIGKRQAPKLLAQSCLKKVMGAGAKGVSIWISGRIKGQKDARVLKFIEGSVPMQNIRADIDYAMSTVQYPGAGTTCVKVWIHR